jgi:hypothetical protein
LVTIYVNTVRKKEFYMSFTEKKEGIEKLYTKKGAAFALGGISTSTVDRLRKKGDLISVLIGGQVMFEESELIKLIKGAA